MTTGKDNEKSVQFFEQFKDQNGIDLDTLSRQELLNFVTAAKYNLTFELTDTEEDIIQAIMEEIKEANKDFTGLNG